jgi:hypothetical protein
MNDYGLCMESMSWSERGGGRNSCSTLTTYTHTYKLPSMLLSGCLTSCAQHRLEESVTYHSFPLSCVLNGASLHSYTSPPATVPFFTSAACASRMNTSSREAL